MDYLKKLKHSVTNVLPVGNPVSAEFDILTHRASAGPGLLWKIYDGSNKSTKQEASVFICEKRSLDKLSKADRDRILDTLKRGVSQLTKLRHPNLLSVVHPLEESRESIAFATEPVFASLANALGRHDNMPVPVPTFFKDFQLFDVEIKYGLFQLCEGLAFLHNSVKLVHSNVGPESILLNKSGAWKIAGFDFCIRNANTTEQSCYYPCPEWDLDCPPIAQPNMDYLAPEYIVSNSCDTASDMFSVGVLFYSIFNKGKTVFECRNELTVFRKNVSELKKMNVLSILGCIPVEVRDYVKLLLNTEPSVRPDADQLSKLSFFEDMGSLTLQYMDSLFQRDNLQKSQFFKGLPKIIEKLPKRINLFRILPPMFKECVNKEMVPFILPSLMLIADQCTPDEYVKHVLPGLKPLLGQKEPVQISLILLQNMNLLLSKTPQAEIKLFVLPMVYEAVEANNAQIQELCLSILPTFASLIDYPAMKNSLIPRIKRICLGTSLLNVRVNCLVCVGKLLEYMDKWYVLDEIIPILQAIPSREPGVLMSMLGIYQVALTHKKLGITKDILATKVIPHLFPLVIDSNLNLQQFNAYMTVIKDMMQRVESEQRGKLEQLNSIHQEQKTIQLGGGESKPGPVFGTTNSAESDTMMDKIMSGFGLMSYLSGAPSSAAKSVNSDTKSSPMSSSSASSLNTSMNSIPTPTPSDTKLPNQPAKVSLTLEEKQKLAKEQEMQQQYKSQSPIKAKPVVNKHSREPVRDLTATLMDSDLMGNAMNGVGSKSNAPLLNSGAISSPFNASSSQLNWSSSSGSSPSNSVAGNAYQSLGPISATSNVNRGSPTFGTTLQQSRTVGISQPSSASSQAQKVDYFAFPSLLSPNAKPKPPLNNMPQSKPANISSSMGGVQSGMQPRGMMGNVGMMGNMQMNPGMVGNMQMNQQRMMGNIQMNHGMMGNTQMNQQRMMGNMQMNPGMMGNMQINQGAFGGSGMAGMIQPMGAPNTMTNGQQATSKKLSSQDLADFLG